MPAWCEFRTHDLRIMRPTRCQLRQPSYFIFVVSYNNFLAKKIKKKTNKTKNKKKLKSSLILKKGCVRKDMLAATDRERKQK